jgi:hypothetical protein
MERVTRSSYFASLPTIALTNPLAQYHRSAEDLWTKAANSLRNPKKKLSIDPQRLDRLTVLKEILELVQVSQFSRLQKRWKFKNRDGKDVTFRELFENTVLWVGKFIVVGDTLMQYDPGHAALPWAAVRLVLQVQATSLVFQILRETDHR